MKKLALFLAVILMTVSTLVSCNNGGGYYPPANPATPDTTNPVSPVDPVNPGTNTQTNHPDAVAAAESLYNYLNTCRDEELLKFVKKASATYSVTPVGTTVVITIVDNKGLSYSEEEKSFAALEMMQWLGVANNAPYFPGVTECTLKLVYADGTVISQARIAV